MMSDAGAALRPAEQLLRSAIRLRPSVQHPPADAVKVAPAGVRNCRVALRQLLDRGECRAQRCQLCLIEAAGGDVDPQALRAHQSSRLAPGSAFEEGPLERQ